MDEVVRGGETVEIGCSRREFMRATATLAGGALATGAYADQEREPLRVPAGTKPSRVVTAQSRRVLDGPVIHERHLAEVLQSALLGLTGKETETEAWNTLLSPDDIVGIKFNRSGQARLGTTDAMAKVLVNSLVDAGRPAEKIVCIEAPPDVEKQLGTTPAAPGYASRTTNFGSGEDHFASVLDQITAIINVPFLKTHNITGMTCALKNLSHGLIKHPARYHENRCTPFIADIVATPAIANKLRLTLVDGLRVVFDRGPEPTASTVSDEGLLLLSRDPVATDTVGLALLNDVRRGQNLAPFARSAVDLDYLADAHKKGLGYAVWHAIDLHRVSS